MHHSLNQYKKLFFVKYLPFVLLLISILTSCNWPQPRLKEVQNTKNIILPQAFNENETEIILLQKQDTIIKTTLTSFQNNIQNDIQQDKKKIRYDNNNQLLNITKKAAIGTNTVHLIKVIDSISDSSNRAAMLQLTHDKLSSLLEEGKCIISFNSKNASNLTINTKAVYGRTYNSYHMSIDLEYLADGVEVFRWGFYTTPSQDKTK